MKERPIICSGTSVRAIQEDRKFVTRRLSKRWTKVKEGDRLWVRETWYCDHCFTNDYEQTGFDGTEESKRRAEREWLEAIIYAADLEPGSRRPDGYEEDVLLRPSIFMPRWASRILLECEEDARVERLWDITQEEALAEGIETCCGGSHFCNYGKAPHAAINHYGEPRASFESLWSTLHTKPGERWADNPEVVRVGRFRRIE